MRLLVISAAALLAVSSPALAEPSFVPGRVLVRWKSPATGAARIRTQVAAHAIGAGRWNYVRPIGGDTHLVATEATNEATQALLDQLRADPDVEYAEPDYVRHRMDDMVTPDDPLFGRQWALPMVRAPQAWSRYTGTAKTVVAIVDTGIVNHAELVARVVGGYDFISDPSNAGDGDGRDADFTDPGSADETSSGLHGTHVAGIVAATSNNDLGVAGLDWACRLLVVRVLGVAHGSGADSDIAAAIRWAAGIHVDGVPDNANPAQVINLSFGGQGYSQSMQDAVSDAVSVGAVIVAAAGNDAIDAHKNSPAGLTGVITVGAVDPSGNMASYSNFGPDLVVMAPGGSPIRDPITGASQGILSTIRLDTDGDTYAELAGTSQAAPFVSATVSLMKTAYPHLTPSDARKLLEASADGSHKCRDPLDPTLEGCGAGLLDVDAALVLAKQAQDSGGFDSHLGNVVTGGCALGGADAGPRGIGLGALIVASLVLLRRRRGRVL